MTSQLRFTIVPALTALLIGAAIFFTIGVPYTHACVGGDGSTKCGTETTVSTASQLELIQKLLAQIESLRQMLATMQSGGNSSGTQHGTCLEIKNDLGYRAVGNEVSALQDFLQAQGHLNSAPTGFYGLMTTEAVKSFQLKYGIDATGYTGPATRAKIKTLMCANASTNTGTADQILAPTNTATPRITSAAFNFTEYTGMTGTIVVSGRNLNNASKLEYQANCCKPIEGTLQRVLTKDGKSYYGLDGYLQGSENNGQLKSLKVRVLDPYSNKYSSWIDVKGYSTDSTDESTPLPEILAFKTNESTITKGESITLSWDTDNDTANCSLQSTTVSNNEWVKENDLGSATTKDVAPLETTKYTLICRGRYQDVNGNYPEVRESLTVSVFTPMVGFDQNLSSLPLNPTITGSVSDLPQGSFGFTLSDGGKVWGSGGVAVIGGRWSITIPDSVERGEYDLLVYSRNILIKTVTIDIGMKG